MIDTILDTIRIFLLALLGMIFVALILGGIVMWCWNTILPSICGVVKISYWQAVILIILIRALTGDAFFTIGPGDEN